jgi:hypothetical protein
MIPAKSREMKPDPNRSSPFEADKSNTHASVVNEPVRISGNTSRNPQQAFPKFHQNEVRDDRKTGKLPEIIPGAGFHVSAQEQVPVHTVAETSTDAVGSGFKSENEKTGCDHDNGIPKFTESDRGSTVAAESDTKPIGKDPNVPQSSNAMDFKPGMSYV